MANILFLTHWTDGDVLPFFKIGRLLKTYGHEITIFTHCVFEDTAKKYGFHFVPIDSQAEYLEMQKDFPVLADAVNDMESVVAFQNKYHGVERLLREYECIKPYCEKEDTLLIFRHRSSMAALLLADKLSLPAISVFLAPNYLSHLDFHEEIMGDAMKVEINKAREMIGLPQIDSWTKWMCSATGIIGLWPKWFASEEEGWPSKLKVMGFPTIEPSQDEPDQLIEKYLERHSKCVIVSGGTSKMVSADFYQTAIKACQFAQVGCIAVIPFEELKPKEEFDGVLMVAKLDLRATLAKVDGIIHHGGMGTLSEALFFKVPQIIMAHLVDRPENAQRLRENDLCLSYPPKRWQPERVAEGIQKILSNVYRKEYEHRIDHLNCFAGEELNDYILEILKGGTDKI